MGDASISNLTPLPFNDETSNVEPVNAENLNIDSLNDENFNESSTRRMELLNRLKGLIDEPVPAAFWATCMFADIDSLQMLVDSEENNRQAGQGSSLDHLYSACKSIVKYWSQKSVRHQHQAPYLHLLQIVRVCQNIRIEVHSSKKP